MKSFASTNTSLEPTIRLSLTGSMEIPWSMLPSTIALRTWRARPIRSSRSPSTTSCCLKHSASSLECHRGHLRVDDYYVKVLTLKEPSAQSFPLILKGLLEIDANYFVVTEWKKEDSGKTRRTIQAKRRHFHNTKRSFRSQV